jgi:hypothetical protein
MCVLKLIYLYVTYIMSYLTCACFFMFAWQVTSSGERVYRDSDRRYHKSDGIIFQPADAPYVFGTDVNLVKWKWPELASVDLQVLPNARKGNNPTAAKLIL